MAVNQKQEKSGYSFVAVPTFVWMGPQKWFQTKTAAWALVSSSDRSQTASMLLPLLYLMAPPPSFPSLSPRRNSFALIWNTAKCQPGWVKSPNKNNGASKSHVCPRLRGRVKWTDPPTLLWPQNYERQLPPTACALFAHHVVTHSHIRSHRGDVQNVMTRSNALIDAVV